MDSEVVLNKLESLRRYIQRIEEKTPNSIETWIENYDVQDIITLNLERAVQTCIDISLHIISDHGKSVPETMAKTFDVMCQAGHLQKTAAERMTKAVGFRNIAVHAY